MTNQERYTVIENIYNNNGVFVVDISAGNVITSSGIIIPDSTQMFLILIGVASGINDVDANLYTKMLAKFDSLTVTLPTTVNVDLKGANSNTNPSADASLYFVTPLTYDDGINPPQSYNFNNSVTNLLETNTGITRVVSSDFIFQFLEKYKDDFLIEVLDLLFPLNYIVYHAETNEFLIVEVI